MLPTLLIVPLSIVSRFFQQSHRPSPQSRARRPWRLNGAIKSTARVFTSSAPFSKSVSRGLHESAVKSMGGHGHDAEPYYLHAKHMYNLDRMKHQKLKISLSVLAAFSIGVGVPVYAVIFQQKKTASG